MKTKNDLDKYFEQAGVGQEGLFIVHSTPIPELGNKSTLEYFEEKIKNGNSEEDTWNEIFKMVTKQV